MTLIVKSCADCDHIVAGFYDSGVVRLRFESQENCPLSLCLAESLAVPLYTFVSGYHQLSIQSSALAKVFLAPVSMETGMASMRGSLLGNYGSGLNLTPHTAASAILLAAP